MLYKLLLLDMDGTLVASRQHAMPSARVVQAVTNAQKRLQVAVVTGRTFAFAKPVTDALDLSGYGIYNGGAEVIDISSGQVIDHQYLSVAKLRELTALALPFGYKVYNNESQYKAPITAIGDLKAPGAKLFIEAVATSDIPKMIDELNSVEGVIAHPTTSWEEGGVMDIHVMHHLASKRHGAEKLIKQLGCTRTEVIAIGDGHNDVPMLEAAGLKIAMGNAPDEVKAVADYIALSLQDDGAAEAIERFILS